MVATLTADDASAPIGLLKLSAGEVVVEVTREAGSTHVERRLTAPGHTAVSPGPADPDGSVELIGEQLARGGKNSLFSKVLPRFRQLLDR